MKRIENGTDGSAERAQRCSVGEIGELIIRIPTRKRPWLGDFEGYLEPRDGTRAVVSNVFGRADRYYRTGDLVRYDEDDYFYFVDRIGEIWRSRGHNVSTIWLASALAETPGVEDVCVVPVALDDTPRRFGLAVVVADANKTFAALEDTIRQLPNYAQPQLVQVTNEIARTATFKPNKSRWRQGQWVPRFEDGPLLVWRGGLEPVAPEQWESIRRQLASDK